MGANNSNQLYLNYFVDQSTKDIYKGIKVGDLVTGYTKYKNVNYRTERSNNLGSYVPLHYPFESFNKSSAKETEYFEPFGTFLPRYKLDDLTEISQQLTLVERLNDDNMQMKLVREMFDIFKKELNAFSIEKMGLDASLQCRLEMSTSDIDLIVMDSGLYEELYNLVTDHHKFEMFSHNVVDRRGAYSSFTSTKELVAFEDRKISFLFSGVKVSILFSEPITLPEYLSPTGSLLFLRTKPGIDKSVGEPSLLELNDIEIIYGPDIDTSKKIYYLSVLPVRTGFLLKKEDTLLITGYIYVGQDTGNIYVSQFTWDYCKLFNANHIALNTYFQLGDNDKRITGHFFENLKL